MRPSKIRPGTKLIIKSSLGSGSNTAYFVKRIPAQCGRQAVNLLRFPAFAGLNGLEDDGTCQMSDYQFSRNAEFAGA